MPLPQVLGVVLYSEGARVADAMIKAPSPRVLGERVR